MFQNSHVSIHMLVKIAFLFNFLATNITSVLWFFVVFHMVRFLIPHHNLVADGTSPVGFIEFLGLTNHITMSIPKKNKVYNLYFIMCRGFTLNVVLIFQDCRIFYHRFHRVLAPPDAIS